MAVERELKKLSTDGAAPQVLPGRTRQQTRDGTVHLNNSGPTDLRKELKTQQIAGVTCPSDHNPELADLEATVMTQLNMKQGIKAFGQAGVNAVQKELKQLHDREVLQPIHAEELSREQKRASLQYLMFLKKKRCGKIKGRGCADDRIRKGELRVEYCPTGNMVADFFTKPLQGALFRRLRDAVLNIPAEDGPASLQQQDHRSVLEKVPVPVEGQTSWAQVVKGSTTTK